MPLNTVCEEFLICRTGSSGIPNISGICARFRWGRIITLSSDDVINCRTKLHRFYSLGESYGVYNNFLGPIRTKIPLKRRARAVGEETNQLGEIHVAGVTVNRNAIRAYLDALTKGGPIDLAVVKQRDGKKFDAALLDHRPITTLTVAEAADTWPMIFTENRRVIEIVANMAD